MNTAEHLTGSFDSDATEGNANPDLGMALAPDAVEVRRNGGLAAAIGAAASAVAIAYLSRATSQGSWLDWTLVVVMGVVGAGYLRSFVDARTPLLVADAHGVRIRLGRTWRGLPWGAIAEVQHTPRRGFVRDGRLVLTPRNPERALSGLEAGGRRAVALNRTWYGAPLVLPLGLSTRVVGADGDLTRALQELAGSAATVSAVSTVSTVSPVSAGSDVEADDATVGSGRPHLRDPRPLIASTIDRVAARLPRLPHREASEEIADDVEDTADLTAIVASATPAPLREPRTGSRVEVTRDLVPGDLDDTETGGRELRRHGSVNLVEDTVVWGERVRPISRPGDAVEPLVIDDFDVEPAPDPVIGPEFTAARTRLGLSVDQLADRTRIRPHVIESIEVDDFVPCGGDFYARGHLRTLARVLGIDVTPLLAVYDDRYADAPINPRRVFEAELATGVGGIRATRGGPNWSLLLGVVMALVLAWSVARLIMDEPADLTRQAPVLNGSGGITHSAFDRVADEPVRAVFRVESGPVRVVVRDGDGKVVLSDELAAGDVRRLRVIAPIRVTSSDGGAVTATIDGVDKGTLGRSGQRSRSTYAPR